MLRYLKHVCVGPEFVGGSDRDMASEPDPLGGSLSKGLRVLASFNERDARLTVAEISERTSVNRASVYRLAGVLEKQGYLKKEGATYQPSSKVFGLGHSIRFFKPPRKKQVNNNISIYGITRSNNQQ